MPVRHAAPVLPQPATIGRVAGNARYLLDQYSNPWFMIGDSAWGLAANVSVSDMQFYFSTRAAQGFNTVLVLLVADTYSSISTTNASTFDGINAFTGTVSGYPDLSTPNSSYWSRMDTMVSLAAQYGITLMLVPVDAANLIGNDSGGNSYCMNMLINNGHTACVNFGTFLGNRYKNSPNVMWMHGNDYASGADDTYVGGVCNGIRGVSTAQLHTIEEVVTIGTDSYSNQAATFWTSPPIIQLDQSYPGNNATASYQIEQTAYASSPVLPAFLGEGRYEGVSGWSSFLLRNQAYWTMVDGNIGGYLYGSQSVYGFTAGWQAALSTTAVTQMGYWAAMFRGLNWWTLLPDTANTFLTSGFSSGVTLALAARAADGSLGVVYAPVNGPLVIDMTKMRGTTIARWYDPTAGTYAVDAASPLSNTGTHSFTSPAAHADTNRDYALVLTA